MIRPNWLLPSWIVLTQPRDKMPLYVDARHIIGIAGHAAPATIKLTSGDPFVVEESPEDVITAISRATQ